ncbi:MAG: L-asparaginase [Symbiobacteriaceae bacterium]|jgi:L-asparaginase|nr:L-asparaginase [Symbiobacteriaceae bacterium]
MATEQKTILIIFTGGTISMQIDPKVGAAVPTLSGQQILATVSHLDPHITTRVLDYGQLPGPHVTPQIMWDLAQVVRGQLADPSIDGVVITHGTDTLEETAYFLDLVLDSEKPVVVTGAMRNASELGFEGPANLRDSILVAACDDAQGLGVLVCMNEQILAASEATKTHTEEAGTFQSPNFGPLGIVDSGRVLFYRRPILSETIPATRVEDRVDLFKMYTGADDRFIRFAVDSGSQGLIIEAMGRGNVPPAAAAGIEYALSKGLPVIITSRALRGRVLDSYGYEGAGKRLRNAGVIFGDFLNSQKSRIKLMLALGATHDPAKVRRYFEEGHYD